LAPWSSSLVGSWVVVVGGIVVVVVTGLVVVVIVVVVVVVVVVGGVIFRTVGLNDTGKYPKRRQNLILQPNREGRLGLSALTRGLGDRRPPSAWQTRSSPTR